MNTNYKEIFKVKSLPESRVEIEGELPYEELHSERTAALTALGKNVKLDGFRPGHIPAPILEKHLGEMAILEEMARRAISHAYPLIVENLELKVIGQPKIRITKLAPDNPLGLSITVSVLPKIKLPDYKAIAADVNKKRPSDEVSDEELDKKIKEIQQQKLAYEQQKDKTGQAGEKPAGNDKKSKENAGDLPELTDEYVKTLGQPGQFNSVEEFKTKLREHLEIEKKRENTDRHRAQITESILEKTDIKIPKVLVDYEINQMMAQLESDLERAELKIEDYLTHIKKTKDDLKQEWLPTAEKRAKLQLILAEIARQEKLSPNRDELKKQTEKILKLHKDAKPEAVEAYVDNIMTNELVIKLLETV